MSSTSDKQQSRAINDVSLTAKPEVRALSRVSGLLALVGKDLLDNAQIDAEPPHKPALDSETVSFNQEEQNTNAEWDAFQASVLRQTVQDFMKLDANPFEPDNQAVDLTCLFKENILHVVQKAKSAGIDVNLEIAPDLPVVSADGWALTRIFTILLSHAVANASTGETIRLSIAAKNKELVLAIAGKNQNPTDKKASSGFIKSDDTCGFGYFVVTKLANSLKGTVTTELDDRKNTRVMVKLPLIKVRPNPVPANPDEQIIFLTKRRKAVDPFLFSNRKAG